ncbi:unnamed protein product [Spodoptera exigua]|nr:unnamed protein product [Spodoptera exigua]
MSRLIGCWLIVLLVLVEKTSCFCDARCSGDKCHAGFNKNICLATILISIKVEHFSNRNSCCQQLPTLSLSEHFVPDSGGPHTLRRLYTPHST